VSDFKDGSTGVEIVKDDLLSSLSLLQIS
jgi:hypothetical protein